MTFEEAMNKLEEMAGKIRQEDITLEEAINVMKKVCAATRYAATS